jgi:hypothetical protein
MGSHIDDQDHTQVDAEARRDRKVRRLPDRRTLRFPSEAQLLPEIRRRTVGVTA